MPTDNLYISLFGDACIATARALRASYGRAIPASVIASLEAISSWGDSLRREASTPPLSSSLSATEELAAEGMIEVSELAEAICSLATLREAAKRLGCCVVPVLAQQHGVSQ